MASRLGNDGPFPYLKLVSGAWKWRFEDAVQAIGLGLVGRRKSVLCLHRTRMVSVVHSSWSRSPMMRWRKPVSADWVVSHL